MRKRGRQYEHESIDPLGDDWTTTLLIGDGPEIPIIRPAECTADRVARILDGWDRGLVAAPMHGEWSASIEVDSPTIAFLFGDDSAFARAAGAAVDAAYAPPGVRLDRVIDGEIVQHEREDA